MKGQCLHFHNMSFGDLQHNYKGNKHERLGEVMLDYSLPFNFILRLLILDSDKTLWCHLFAIHFLNTNVTVWKLRVSYAHYNITAWSHEYNEYLTGDVLPINGRQLQWKKYTKNIQLTQQQQKIPMLRNSTLFKQPFQPENQNTGGKV